MKSTILQQIIKSISSEVELEPISENISDAKLQEIILKGINEKATELIEHIQKKSDMWFVKYRNANHDLCTKNKTFYQKGFDHLDLLYYLSIEIGMFLQEMGKEISKKSYAKEHVLFRLHAKSLQVFAEIICLLKGGLADGALGRWRSLYECSILMNCITSSPEEISIRFLNHVEVERAKKMELYNELAPDHFRRFSQQELSKATEKAQKIIEHFGIGFDDDYGWANPLFPNKGKKRVTFDDISRKCSMLTLKMHYKWACEKIHVTTNSLYRSIGINENDDIMMAGASDNGFQDPVALSTISMDQIITFMCMHFSCFDSSNPTILVLQRMFDLLSKQTELIFIDLQKQKDQNYQRSGHAIID